MHTEFLKLLFWVLFCKYLCNWFYKEQLRGWCVGAKFIWIPLFMLYLWVCTLYRWRWSHRLNSNPSSIRVEKADQQTPSMTAACEAMWSCQLQDLKTDANNVFFIFCVYLSYNKSPASFINQLSLDCFWSQTASLTLHNCFLHLVKQRKLDTKGYKKKKTVLPVICF